MTKTVKAVCPNCGKSDFTNSCKIYLDNEVGFACACKNCKTTWTDWYKLTYVNYTVEESN